LAAFVNRAETGLRRRKTLLGGLAILSYRRIEITGLFIGATELKIEPAAFGILSNRRLRTAKRASILSKEMPALLLCGSSSLAA
jgi:hypothetical protein